MGTSGQLYGYMVRLCHCLARGGISGDEARAVVWRLQRWSRNVHTAAASSAHSIS